MEPLFQPFPLPFSRRTAFSAGQQGSVALRQELSTCGDAFSGARDVTDCLRLVGAGGLGMAAGQSEPRGAAVPPRRPLKLARGRLGGWTRSDRPASRAVLAGELLW